MRFKLTVEYDGTEYHGWQVQPNGRSVEVELFPHRIAFNVLPQVGEFVAAGTTAEERQTITTLRRVLGQPELCVSLTRVRVPCFYGTALAVSVETRERLAAAAAGELLRGAPGILLQDDPGARLYPTPAEAVGQDATCVGRIRADDVANVLDLWIAIDNIRKGSAVNAVQIGRASCRERVYGTV